MEARMKSANEFMSQYDEENLNGSSRSNQVYRFDKVFSKLITRVLARFNLDGRTLVRICLIIGVYTLVIRPLLEWAVKKAQGHGYKEEERKDRNGKGIESQQFRDIRTENLVDWGSRANLR